MTVGSCNNETGQSASASPQTVTSKASIYAPRVVTHSHYDDGAEEVVVGSDTFRSTRVTVGEDQHQDFHGQPPQNEDDVLQVCRTVRSVLNAQGGRWAPFVRASGATSDVDATASDDAGGPPLQVQVTRVERAAWATLAREGKAILNLGTAGLADGIRDAVNAKRYPPEQRAQLLLALDACRSPGYVHEAVVAEFRAKHQDWVDSLGYQAIWLVGPTDAMTHRLDRPATAST